MPTYDLTPLLTTENYILVFVNMMDKNFDPQILDEERIRRSYPKFEIKIESQLKKDSYGKYFRENLARIKFFVK